MAATIEVPVKVLSRDARRPCLLREEVEEEDVEGEGARREEEGAVGVENVSMEARLGWR